MYKYRKILFSILLIAIAALALSACGGKSNGYGFPAWDRQGVFADDSGDMLRLKMDLPDGASSSAAHFYAEVRFHDGKESKLYSGTLDNDADGLYGTLAGPGKQSSMDIRITEADGDGVVLSITDQGDYVFTPTDEPFAAYEVSVDVEGTGQITYAKVGEEIRFDGATDAEFVLQEPAAYILGAETFENGWEFAKWLKDGREYSDEPLITVYVDADMSFTAVFETVVEPEQSPLLRYAGEYEAENISAAVDIQNDTTVFLTVMLSENQYEPATLDIEAQVAPGTTTAEYSGYMQTTYFFDTQGVRTRAATEWVDENGSFVFNTDGSMIWKSPRLDSWEQVLESADNSTSLEIIHTS